jgi:PAS domain S-box-containing protein
MRNAASSAPWAVAVNHPIGVLYQFWPRPDGTGRMVFISKGAEAFLESTAEEIGWMLERRCLPLFGIDEEKFYSSIEHAIWQKVPWSSEMGYLTPKTHRRLWLHLQSFPQTAPDGQWYFSGHWIDLTPMKKAEQESRLAYRTLSTHLENTPLAVIEWDHDFRIDRWSGQAEAIFGWTAEEVRGKWANEWPFVHPDDAGRVADVIRKLHTQAEPRNVCINRNLHKSGRVLHCVWHNSVVLDADGRLVSILSLVEDQTDKVELDRQLMEAHRLENIGFLAGGIAHAFNNLMTIIGGHAGIVRESPAGSAAFRSSLDEIDEACRRATRLCEQITTVAGVGEPADFPLELDSVVSAARPVLASIAGTPERLAFDLSGERLAIRGDARQLQQVLESLVSNAVEASAGTEFPIAVRTRLETLAAGDGAEDGFYPTPAPGAYAGLSVADRGPGIPEAIRSKIFEPYFSTKGTGRGLGLAAVRGILHAHRGSIRIESAPGAGTLVEVLIPISQD